MSKEAYHANPIKNKLSFEHVRSLILALFVELNHSLLLSCCSAQIDDFCFASKIFHLEIRLDEIEGALASAAFKTIIASCIP